MSKFWNAVACIGGSMGAMMLTIGALEPNIDSARMMAISILCGSGAAIASLLLISKRSPSTIEGIQKVIRTRNLSPTHQLTLMDAIAILEDCQKG